MATDERTRHYFAGLRLSALATALVCLLGASVATAESLKPGTDYRPQEVVSIVIEALRTNDADGGDEGIATAFRFASPQNRSQTGPLARFTAMLKTGYGDMLNHLANRRDPMRIDDGVALQAVWVTGTSGSETGYMFQLGKQKSGEFAGMWMTDAVYSLGPGEDGQAI